MSNLKAEIQNFINSTITVYKSQPERINADRDAENEAKKDYKGRELFELLQNADDQGAEEVLFDVDISNSVLTVANTGKSFSPEGYKSILLQSNSSKKSEEYIGNKGKGFRSILTWADEITIISNNIKLIFSDKISQQILQQNIKPNIVQNKQAAILAFCSINDTEYNENQKWATQIIIKYKKDYLKDINNQLDFILKTKCLLEFLNNIKTLTVNNESVHKNTNDYEILSVVNEAFPPNCSFIEKNDVYKKYQIKGLISDKIDFTKEPLYSYLPTNIYLNIPILFHVTFDLDSSRKRINNSDKNSFIFDRVIDYIEENIIQYTKRKCSWYPYYLITYKDINIDIENTFGFYSKLDNLKQKLNIIPCIDGKYRNINNVIFTDSAKSDFIEQLYKQIDLPKEFLCIAKSIPDYIGYFKERNANKISMAAFSKLSKALVGVNNEIEIRASLIKLFVEDIENSLPNDWESSSDETLLIDNNKQIIKYNQQIFTHRPQHDAYELPSYTNITFLHDKLYKTLINKFDCQERKGRQLKQYLGKISQIEEYEASPLIEHIISDTRKIIANNPNNSISNIKSMIKSIYSIWDESMDGITRVKVPILTDNLKIVDAENAFFDDSYKKGIFTKYVWGEYIQNSEEYSFILNKNSWGFQFEEEKFTKLLERLGVKSTFDENFLTDNLQEIFENFNLTQIVLLCNFQPSIFYNYALKDNISKICKIENYVLECKNMSFINADYTLDINGLKNEFNMCQSEIDRLLVSLGAKPRVEDLSMDAIKDIIVNKLKKYKPYGECAQTLYTLLIEKNMENKKSSNSKNNYKIGESCYLYSKNKENYFRNSELYYYDNKTIPAKFIEQYPIIDLPKRRGEKQVLDIFGVNTFKNLKFKVKNAKLQKSLTNEFKEYIETLTPLFTAYSATDVVDYEKKIKENRKELEKINYKLCSEISLLCNDNIYPQQIQDFEFINITDENTYYLKVPKHVESLKVLNNDYKIEIGEFIAEVIAIAFKVSDGERFSSIYKDANILYSEKKFRENYPSKILDFAKRENKFSVNESFWKRIYDLKKEDKLSFEKWYSNKCSSWDIDWENFSEDDAECTLNCLYEHDITDLRLFFEEFNEIDFSKYNVKIYKNKYEQIYDDKIFPVLWQKSLSKESKMCDFEDMITQFQWSKIYQELLGFPKICANRYEDNHEKKIWEFLAHNGIKEDDCITKNRDEIIKIKKLNEEKYKQFLDEINNSHNHSLLYFEDTTALEAFCNTIQEQKVSDDISPKSADETPFVPLKEVSDIGKYLNHNSNPRKARASHHSHLSDKQKDIIGRKNEEAAKKTLIASGKYVKVEDSISDSDGYDIRCCTKDGNYHYYEVKTFGGDGFYMSFQEYQTYYNLKPAYMIFLVLPNNEYKIIKDIEKECCKKDDNYKIVLREIIIDGNIE